MKAQASEAPKLWGVHVCGPDAYVPTECRESARVLADTINTWFLTHENKSANDPIVFAYPTRWPYTAGLHALEIEIRRQPGADYPLQSIIAPLFQAAGVNA